MSHLCGGSGCSGNCSGCGGCPSGGSLELTKPELLLLEILSQVAFLAVARRPDDMTPACEEIVEFASQALQHLERKGLVSLDYDKPLGGFDYSIFLGLKVHGSAALTERGQNVLALMEIQGVDGDLL